METRRKDETALAKEPDSALIQKLRCDQEAAFEVLQSRYRPLVWSICMRVLLDRDDADDATQHTFVKLFVNRQILMADRPLGPWLRAVALKTCIDNLRTYERLREVPFEDRSSDGVARANPALFIADGSQQPDQIARFRDLKRGFQRCWRLLSVRQRAFLQAIDWSDWKKSSADIAEGRQLSPEAVRVSTVRHARRLLQCLREQGYRPSPSELLEVLEDWTSSQPENQNVK